MQRLEKPLSRLVELAVLGMVVLAIIFNFTIIAQALLSPLREVQGNSMKPYIEEDDAVLVTGVVPEKLKPGDVVIFPDPENRTSSIVHRIVSLEEREGDLVAVTKGDANPDIDPFVVPAHNIYGKVHLVLPRGGAFLRFLLSPYGFVLCVLCPFLVLALHLVGKKYQEDRGKGNSFLLREVIRT